MAAEQHPNQRRPTSSDRYGGLTSRGTGVALIAGMAFVFGVLLHGCVVLSIFGDDGNGGSSSGDDAPIVVPADGEPGEEPSPTPSPLPDRTECDEIRDTDYRSGSEREFFLANCITPTPEEEEPEDGGEEPPDGEVTPPLDGGTPAVPEEEDEDES